MTAKVNPSLHTMQQVAEMLSVSVQTVARLVRNNELKAIKLGRQVRISQDAVDSYLARKEVSQ
jgi:excisionase family DNA binding protein